VNGKRIVIDASVALKWRLRDEEATQQADALLEDFLASKLVLLTPTLFDYEIANALRVAVTRQRLSAQDAAAALADFAPYAIVRYDFSGIASRTFHLSGQHQRSAYDSAYMELKRRACGFSPERSVSSMLSGKLLPGSSGWATTNSAPFQRQNRQYPSLHAGKVSPNNGVQPTDYSVRSCGASASSGG
jgi:predicted nucleic acid-binding protein